MNRYLLEILIFLQGIVLGWFIFSFSGDAFANPSRMIMPEFLIGLCILAFITYIAIRLDWSARVLYQRRAASIIESRRRLHRSHKALQQLARNQAQHGDNTESALKDLCETALSTLEVSVVSLWLYDRDQAALIRTITFDAQNGFSKVNVHAPIESIKAYITELSENRIVSITCAKSDQMTRNFFSVRTEGICSLLDAPIYLEGELGAVFCLDQRGVERIWTSEEENFTASLADLAALILETERRKVTEYELRRRSIAIESALDGMAILDRQECFVYLNDAHARVYGYQSPKELIGRHWSVLYSDAERLRFEKELMPQLQAQGRICIEATGQKKDRSTFPQELILTCIPGDGLICTVRDISARKAAEEKLIESKRFLRTVIDADPHMIFVKNRAGRFTMANKAVAELYGTSVENLIGKTDGDFNGKNNELEKFQSDDLKVIDNGQELFVAEETVTDSKGAERLLQTIKRPLLDAASGQMQVLGVCTDITQLKMLHQQLVQSQKMEAIGQLAGGIAHDFNNLLTGILGYADMLQAVSSEPNEVRNAADMISGAARRASELTEKLLGFARKGKNQNIPVDVHATIREALSLIERTVQKDILLVEQLNADRAYVRGDPVQIEQVILNLVINARDAIAMSKERSGYDRITIATKLLRIAKDFEIADLPTGEYLEISVADSGCGIADELRDRIFEPFFTTKESGKGTGMGLAMVYGIVKNHEGTVMVESQLGVGTTFRILLPTCQHISEAPRVRDLGTVQTGKGSILIVDDHPVIREVTKEMLILLGYQVTTVEDGPEAINLVSSNNCYDLVILDMVMPKMNARDCIKSLKVIDPIIKIILSTGYGKNELVQELLGYGLVGFIQKPYHLVKLSEVVAEALQSSDFFVSVKADNIEHA